MAAMNLQNNISNEPFHLPETDTHGTTEAPASDKPIEPLPTSEFAATEATTLANLSAEAVSGSKVRAKASDRPAIVALPLSLVKRCYAKGNVPSPLG